MNFKNKKILSIAGLITGAICIILTFISDVFLIVGFLIIGVSFLLFDKYRKEEKRHNEDENLLENKNITQVNNSELSTYKELISNDFSLDNIDSNFNASLVLMALNQIKENAYFNPNDINFDIDIKIEQVQQLGKKKFLESKYKDFIAVDTETTGLDSFNDRIIQIALIKVKDGEIVDKFISYVNPQMHISPEASKINNIYDNDVKNAKTIKELFPSILEFIEDYPLVMHNARFDMAFIKDEYYRCYGKNMPKVKYFCTMKLWQELYLKYQGEKVPNAKLNTLVLNLLTPQEISEYSIDKHSADCDAIATCKVFMKMYDDGVQQV